MVIRLEGIKMEEKKVKGVLDWIILKEVKYIQKFLGLANYYQQFIKNFVIIARPLYDLVKKESEVELDGKAGEGILGVEEEVHKKTSISNTRFRQKNKDRSKCIRLHDRRYIIYGM